MTGVAPVVLLVFLALGSIAVSALLSAAEEAGRAVTRAAATDAWLEAKKSRKKRAAAVVTIAEDTDVPVRVTSYVRLVLEMSGAVCITLLAAAIFSHWWAVLGAAVTASAIVMLLIVTLSPRSFGRRNPVLVLEVVGPVMLFLARAVRPVSSRRRRQREEDRHLVGDEALQDMVDRVAESADIEDDERDMLHSVFEFSHTIVREIMVPRTDMLTINQDKEIDEALTLFVRSGFSRIPVVGDAVDDLRGVLYLKDALRYTWHHPGRSTNAVHHLAREAVFIPEMKLIDDVLAEMRSTGVHIAIVFDEYGGIAGLVTIEDILEELVGDLVDEHDASESVAEPIDGGYRVSARYPLNELGELFDIDIEDDDVDSTGGLVAKALGHVPILGAVAYSHGLRLEVVETFGRRRLLHTVAVTTVEVGEEK